MPAIQLARLKIQITQLAEKFAIPAEFTSILKDIFEFYSDRTRKSGRGVPIYSLTRAYNVPLQVTREIERTLQPIALANPENALAIADLLWRENWLEYRILALSILGWLPATPPERILERIDKWLVEFRHDRLLNRSLSNALVSLWKETPEIFLGLLGSWLKSSETDLRTVGLRVIPSLVNDPDFLYLPQIFNMLAPIVQRVELVPDSELVYAICVLAKRSPQETAYYLRRNQAISENPGVFALIRQCLDAFPATVRADLLDFLHNQREASGDH